MESLIRTLFLHQWQRKLVALLTALIIWFLVSQSITSTRTLPAVPIRIINLPPDKTIQGLLPNGFLSKRTPLTLTGTKEVVDRLEPGDVALMLDVSSLPQDGLVQVTKKNLTSLNPSLNLSSYITAVAPLDLTIKMSSMLTEKIPITLLPPSGEAPKGYEFLDVWPLHLYQTVSGPQEAVMQLKNKGLEIRFNLDEVTKEQLEAAKESYQDEVTFLIPESWKKVLIPFYSRTEPLNDPEAKHLRMTFLHPDPLPLKSSVPLQLFYPLKYSDTLNPTTTPLAPSSFIRYKNDIPVISPPLYANHVSRLFLSTVQDNLEISVLLAPPQTKEYLAWSLSVVDAAALEETYVAHLLQHSKVPESPQNKNRMRESYFRARFRHYLDKLTLFIAPTQRLEILSKIEGGKVVVHLPNAPKDG